MRLALVSSLAMSLGACAATPAGGGPTVFSGEGSAGLNQTAVIGDVHIRPLEVLEDSRCPEDVDCIHAGFFRVRVEIRTAREARTEIMEWRRGLALEDARSLTLTEITPGRRHRPPPDTRPYRLTFTLGPGD